MGFRGVNGGTPMARGSPRPIWLTASTPGGEEAPLLGWFAARNCRRWWRGARPTTGGLRAWWAERSAASKRASRRSSSVRLRLMPVWRYPGPCRPGAPGDRTSWRGRPRRRCRVPQGRPGRDVWRRDSGRSFSIRAQVRPLPHPVRQRPLAHSRHPTYRSRGATTPAGL